MNALDGRVVVVTGAGRGVGAAVAAACAREGAAVVVNDPGVELDGTGGDRSPAQQVVDQIVESGGVAVPHYADVSVTDDAEDLVDTAIRTYGQLDVLINLAGIVRDRMVFNMTPEEWDAVIAVHLRGTFNTTRAAARHWRAERRGDYRLINTTSGAGYFGAPGQPNYAAAKMGIIGFTYSCANALLRYGVTANVVSPGGATRMNRDIDMARLGLSEGAADVVGPESSAPAIVYVASAASGWFTGQVFATHGPTIRLMNRPQFVREITTTGEMWTVDEVFRHFESAFRPATEHTDNRYEEVARRELEEQRRRTEEPA